MDLDKEDLLQFRHLGRQGGHLFRKSCLVVEGWRWWGGLGCFLKFPDPEEQVLIEVFQVVYTVEEGPEDNFDRRFDAFCDHGNGGVQCVSLFSL